LSKAEYASVALNNLLLADYNKMQNMQEYFKIYVKTISVVRFSSEL
jgi:hypothetical protein